MSGARYYWNTSNKREEFGSERIKAGDVFEVGGCKGNCSIKACYDSRTGNLYLSIGYKKGVRLVISNNHNLVDERNENMPSTRFVDFMSKGKDSLTDLLKEGKMTFEDILRADTKKIPDSYRDQFFDELTKLLEKHFDFPADLS
jgi:hypothetical protein